MKLLRVAIESQKTATRLQVQTDADGTVRVQQLAYSRSAGWYVQKTLRIPAEALHNLIVELRKAQCLSPLSSGAAAHPEALPVVPKPFHPLEKRHVS